MRWATVQVIQEGYTRPFLHSGVPRFGIATIREVPYNSASLGLRCQPTPELT
jgi:hypothetical protein